MMLVCTPAVAVALCCSRDGARVPVFYVRAKLAEGAPVEPRPCLLYGYGGFSISLCPSFSSTRLVWLQELGGVYAQACIRGGSEYGEEWHTAGSLLNKQNCFDDFIAAAEHLVAKGITSPGGSRGYAGLSIHSIVICGVSVSGVVPHAGSGACRPWQL